MDMPTLIESIKYRGPDGRGEGWEALVTEYISKEDLYNALFKSSSPLEQTLAVQLIELRLQLGEIEDTWKSILRKESNNG